MEQHHRPPCDSDAVLAHPALVEAAQQHLGARVSIMTPTRAYHGTLVRADEDHLVLEFSDGNEVGIPPNLVRAFTPGSSPVPPSVSSPRGVHGACLHFESWRAHGRCDVVLIERSELPHVVVVSERADNPGPSITNAIERVASAADLFVAQHGVPPLAESGYVLIEHYPERGDKPATYDRVRLLFAALDEGYGYMRPEWQHIGSELPADMR